MNDDAILDLAIMRLQRAYADLATRRAFSEVAELATPDAIFSFDLRSGQIFEQIVVVCKLLKFDKRIMVKQLISHGTEKELKAHRGARRLRLQEVRHRAAIDLRKAVQLSAGNCPLASLDRRDRGRHHVHTLRDVCLRQAESAACRL